MPREHVYWVYILASGRNGTYFEEYGHIEAAIAREKSMKHWRRAWKLQLIEKENPQWRDLWIEIAD